MIANLNGNGRRSIGVARAGQDSMGEKSGPKTLASSSAGATPTAQTLDNLVAFIASQRR